MKNQKRIVTFFIFCILILFVFLLMKNKLLRILYPKTYREIVSLYAETYDVEEDLIFAVIKAESNFNSHAISNRNAIGLMQLMEETAKDVASKNKIEIDVNHTKEQIADVYKNIEIGTCYLSILMQRYGNKEIALAAYNAGIGTVDGWIEKGIIKKDGTDVEKVPYKETNQYIRKILRDYRIYKDLYKN